MKYLLSILCLFVFSCSTEGFSILADPSVIYPPTIVENIKVYTRAPNTPYIVIGTVEGVAATDDYFTEKKTQEAALLALKNEAARIGSDALILYDKSSTAYGTLTTFNMFKKIHLTAEAIKFSEELSNSTNEIVKLKIKNSSDDIISKLEDYKEMLDKGLITDEDYEKKKNELLNIKSP